MVGEGLREVAGFREKEMKKNLSCVFFILCLCVLILAGCGYASRSIFSEKFKAIYIEPFVNKVDFTEETYVANKYRIYRPMLESDITRSVIDRFLFEGSLRPVKEEDAELVLKGQLTEFRKDPLRYSDDDEVIEYRINIVVNISLWDKRGNKQLWEENNFIGDSTYFTTGIQAESEEAAINDALKDLARRVVERTVEEW
jgi:hypothetical protein